MEVSKQKNSDAPRKEDDILDNKDLFCVVDKVIKEQKEKRERGELVVTVK